MQITHRTHQGLVRANNQDALIAEDGVYGVADGMGGHRGGETASKLAVDTLSIMLRGKMPDPYALRMGVQAANRRIFDKAAREAELSGMGTTLTVLWDRGTLAYIAHVGDSRIYLLREGTLSQVTQDHSMVAELVRSGVITAEAARTHPYRNVITRAVGVDPVVETDVFSHDLKPGDVWLICSDGLHGMVTDERIAQVLGSAQDDEAAADTLLREALNNGGTDNITFLIARVTEVNA